MTETREQTMAKIEIRLPELTDAELRVKATFIRSMEKGRKTEVV